MSAKARKKKPAKARKKPSKAPAPGGAKAKPDAAAKKAEAEQPAKAKDKRLPTPIVLGAVSAMISAGLVGIFWRYGSDPELEVEAVAPPVDVDDSSPERAAESFLDAWRKRDHAVAEALAVGEALQSVQDRRAREGPAADPQLERIWEQMAAERLGFAVDSAENLEGGALRLVGVAEGTFLGEPYSREIAFEVREMPDGWRVAKVTFGDILEGGP